MKLNIACLAAALVLSPAMPAHTAMLAGNGEPTVIGGMASTEKSKAHLAESRKAVAKIKPVDVNSASEKQLMRLPGIGAAEAKRIIAGRPYASKLWLVTHGVLGEGPYSNLKHLIEAKQPFQTVEENAAFYEKVKSTKAATP